MIGYIKNSAQNYARAHAVTSWPQLLYIGALVLVGEHSANAYTVQEIAKKSTGSTLLLVMEDANGQPLAFGSGFPVRNGEVASNLHVVKGAVRGYAQLVDQNTKHDIEGIVAVDPKRDLVVLKISSADLPGLPLGDSDVVQIGESVYAVGNPRGLEGTFSQGIVSSIREVGTDKLLQITAPISPGSSGGPVLNSKGEVIGVSVATFKGGQNLNFAIPVNYLKTLLEKPGPVKPLAQAKSTKAQRSIMADLGDRSTEGVTGGQFLWHEHFLIQYSFSLRNHLRENVSNVDCLIIFYDKQGAPIDTFSGVYIGEIPAGLAKRVSSQDLAHFSAGPGVQLLTKKVEFRILHFDIVQ